jgi:hypothetical protein
MTTLFLKEKDFSLRNSKIYKQNYVFLEVLLSDKFTKNKDNVESKHFESEDFIKLCEYLTGKSKLKIDINFNSFATLHYPVRKMLTPELADLIGSIVSSENENENIDSINIRFDEESFKKDVALKNIENEKAVEKFKAALHKHYGLDDNEHNFKIVTQSFEMAKIIENELEDIHEFMDAHFVHMVHKTYVKLKDLSIKNPQL